MDSFARPVANFHHCNDWPPKAKGNGQNSGKGKSSYASSVKGERREGTNTAAKGQAYYFSQCEHFRAADSNHEMQKMQNLARILAREEQGQSGMCSYAHEAENFSHVNDWIPNSKGIGKNRAEGKSSYAHSEKGACREGMYRATNCDAHHFDVGENFNHGSGWLPNARGIGKNMGVGVSCYAYSVKGACSKGKYESATYSYAHPAAKGRAYHLNEVDDFNHVKGCLPRSKGNGKNKGRRKGADESGASYSARSATIAQSYRFNECENFDRDNFCRSSALSVVPSPSCVTIVHEEDMHRHCEIANAHSGAIVAIAMQEHVIYTASKDKTLKRWKPEKDATGHYHLREDLMVKLEEACFCMCCIGGWIFCGLWDGSVMAFSQDGVNQRLRGHSKRVTAIIQHQSILITGSADRDVRLWQMDPGTEGFFCSHTLKSCMLGAISCLYVLGENLWIGGMRGIALCNLGTLKVTKLLLPMSSVASFVEFQGCVIAAYVDGIIRIFDGDGNQKSEMPALSAGPIISIGGLEAGPRILCGHLHGQVSTIALPELVYKTQFQAFHDIDVECLFCPGQDGLFLIGSKFGSLQMWQKIGPLNEVLTSPETEVITSPETIESSQALVQDETTCIVCLAMPSDVALAPCGHALMCMECAITMFDPEGNAGEIGMHICTTNNSCPTCRGRVDSFLRIYK